MRSLYLFLLFTFSAPSCHPTNQIEGETEFIKGVYGNPATLLNAGYRFDSLGMNAVFVRNISLNQEFYTTAKEQGVKVYVEFPTLNGKEYLHENSEAWPIDEKGEQSPPADWFIGICPTHEGFKDYRKEQLLDILDKYVVDGVFLDYVHWHAQFETTEPILPETCFCDRCTKQFGKEIQREIPGESIPQKASYILTNHDKEWRKWRSDILNSWIEDMGAILQGAQPEAKLGVFYCSWFPADYDSALYRNLGIDPVAIAERADVLSPMLFHHMKGRPTAWVGEYTEWLGEAIQSEKTENPIIWPIVQAHNNPGVVSPEEFRQVMIEGSKKPSSGIMMFSDQSLVSEPEKLKVMRELYTK